MFFSLCLELTIERECLWRCSTYLFTSLFITLYLSFMYAVCTVIWICLCSSLTFFLFNDVSLYTYMFIRIFLLYVYLPTNLFICQCNYFTYLSHCSPIYIFKDFSCRCFHLYISLHLSAYLYIFFSPFSAFICLFICILMWMPVPHSGM